MAKTEELIDGFGSRIKQPETGVKNERKPKPTKKDKKPLAEPISEQERVRRSRAGRKKAGSTETRLGDTMTFTSLRLHTETYNKIREIARRNGLPYCDLINAAIRKFIELYEAKNGVIELPRESNISADSLI